MGRVSYAPRRRDPCPADVLRVRPLHRIASHPGTYGITALGRVALRRIEEDTGSGEPGPERQDAPE